MANIFKFQNEKNTSQSECGMCDLVDGTLEYTFEVAESKEELEDFLIDSLYKAKQIGYKEAMQELIMYGVMSINDLACDCEECDDEDCDC